ncbi:RrF2 family transcriptional regulator [Neolewinella persica]|uniref:RrF2 family transcriptional regulator n=1 Tax=Neolewinella persica TaxID=70998 RepID=UPI00035CDB0C|nr:Rrf2 family transcriptional regulator [Neolewinella persica]
MFSNGCEYGIRALTIIGRASKEDRKVGIKEICRLAKTPESFTAKIMQNLVRRGILDSQKGPAGGFYISKDLDSITLYDIVEAIDGTGVFVSCGLGLAHCDASRPCPLHDKFASVRQELKAMCKSNTLNDLLSGLHDQVYKR